MCDVCWKKNPLVCLDEDSQHVQSQEQKEMLVLHCVCGKTPVNIQGCLCCREDLPPETAPSTLKITAEESSPQTTLQVWTLSPSLYIQ